MLPEAEHYVTGFRIISLLFYWFIHLRLHYCDYNKAIYYFFLILSTHLLSLVKNVTK
jgi:hypothetical protein